METLRDIAALQRSSDADRQAGRRLALVPTMGALHAGHLALVAEARRRAERVCVSIYLNPTQFAAGEDLSAYPRTLESDLAACEAAGVDQVFLPDDAALYPPGAQTWVEVSELAKPLCGRARPEHFRGVATVVTKLLVAARPALAVFGEKDFQQLAVIRRLVRDLGFDVEILGVPIVREADGLALSSRNANLAPGVRGQATALVRALDEAERTLAAGETRVAALLAGVRAELAKAPAAELDYAELRDPDSLEPAPERLERPTLLALAVYFPARSSQASPSGSPAAGSGSEAPRVRLIDNRVLQPQPDQEGRP